MQNDQNLNNSNLPSHLVGVWAHPDDEAYLSAGLMAEVVDAGGRVTVIAVTDGEAGFPDSDGRPPDERSAQRRAELCDALAVLGVRDVRFLGLPDGEVAAHAACLGRRLAPMLIDLAPDTIVTFGPEGITGHEDHIATWRATTWAWLDAEVGDLWYAAKTQAWIDDWRQLHDEFGVWMTDEPTGVNGNDIEHLVGLEGPTLARKRASLAGHASQTAGLATAFGEDVYLQWISEEAFRRPTHRELVEVDPSTAISRWGHLAGVS